MPYEIFKWYYLGGNLNSAPTISSWRPGRIDIFGVYGDNNVYQHFREGNTEYTWSNYFANPPGVFSESGLFMLPVAPDRLMLFMNGCDGACYYKIWDNGWQPWVTVAHPKGIKLIWAPTACVYKKIYVSVFCVGDDLSLWQTNLTGSFQPKTDDNGWTNLGKAGFESPKGFWSSPGCAIVNDRLYVFANGVDGEVWSREFQFVQKGMLDGKWQPVSDNFVCVFHVELGSVKFNGSLSVATRSAYYPQSSTRLLSSAENGNLYYRNFSPSFNGSWTELKMPKRDFSILDFSSCFVSNGSEDHYFTVVFRGSDHKIRQLFTL